MLSLIKRAALVLAGPLLLTACLLVPGKFTSNFDIAADGKFSFAYKGEIVLIGFAEMIAERDRSRKRKAERYDGKCYGPLPPGAKPELRPQAGAGKPVDDKRIDPGAMPALPGERECTEEERAVQAEASAERETEDRLKSEKIKQMFGFDPEAEGSLEAFAAELRKQDGWKSVVYKGNGVFEVDYRITGRLDRDFVFPVYPRTTAVFPMVIATRAADGTIRVTAPGFAPGAGAGELMYGRNQQDRDPNQPQTEGVFTLTSRAELVSNNAETGQTAGKLTWTIMSGTKIAPEAVVKTGR